MPVKRMIGLGVIILGVVLLIMGISASSSLNDQILQGTVGSYSSSTTILLIIGIVLIIAGGVVMMMGRKRR